MSDDTRYEQARQIEAAVLFADLVGFDRLSTASGTERAYLSVTQLLRELDGVARQHGGSVDKYLGDKLMALFGHPVPLHDPELAAALAALEMRRQVARFNREAGLVVPLGLRIGINAGPIVSGDVAGPVVREFHVLGDAVNVSARINARAPVGEIWVGASVHDAIREQIGARALEPLVFKGKSHPVDVFALEAPNSAQVSSRLDDGAVSVTPMCGRASELDRFAERVSALMLGTGGAIRIVGEAGAGKSRLLAELGRSALPEGLRVMRLEGRSFEAARPRAIVRALLDASGALEAVDVGSRLEEQVQAFTREGPVLLVIEDVHRLGAEARALVDDLGALAESSALLVLTTARPTSGEAPPTVETWQLPPLEDDEARALVAAVIGDDASPELLDQIVERGGRVPGSLLSAAHLAPAIRSELEQAGQRPERSSEAERRRAVIVFADLTGFTAMTEKLGAERTYPVVARCLEILDGAARDHGGTIDHYLGDCVMATFGVPHALEDAPRAALNAAIEMRARIQRFSETHALPVPVDVHTGVATGFGIAGDISGPMIREFAVMGDHVDRADALTHLAEAGQIFVDEETRKATGDVFDLELDGTWVLPGAAAAQPVWSLESNDVQLHRARVGAGRQVFSEIVGRDEELSRIREAIAGVAAGTGGIVSLSAEAGIGKSRLLAEIEKSPEVAETGWLVGRALSNGRNVRYHPLADLLRSWVGADDADEGDSARRKLDAAVGALLPDDKDDTAPLLAMMMGVDLSAAERERIESIQGDAKEKILRAAFVRLLRAATALRPVVIVMEDLHWADLSTVELIESVAGLSAEIPILFLLAFRPGFLDTSGRLLEWARERHADRHLEILLAPLDASAARSMVKNLFRGGDVPQRTRAAIEERAHGNPFYIEEVVRTLVDAGAVELLDGAFRATERLEEVRIPDTVQEAVMARVDRLDLAHRSVLQAAAVIGGTFDVDVLQAVLGGDDPRAMLVDLDGQEFITPSDRSSGLEYAFMHPLIPEIIYDALLEQRREALHLEVARATEARLSESIPGYSAMLAYHFGRGRDMARAEEYLFRAGDEASRAAASNEALHFFQEASALYEELYSDSGETEKRARLEKSVAVALMNRGRLIEAVEHFDKAARLLGHDSPRGAVRMSLRFVKNLARVLLRLYTGRIEGRRVADDRDKELIDLLLRRAMAQSTTNPTHFFVDCTDSLSYVSRLDPISVPESAAIYAGLASIFSFGGISLDVSRRLLESAHRLADAGAVDERFMYYRALNYLHHMLAGQWSDEHEVPADIVDEAIREGRFWEASTYTDLDSQVHVYQGRFDVVKRRVSELGALVDLYDNELASSAMRANTALLHIERRELGMALEAIAAYYEEHPEVLFNIVALGMRARVKALSGDLEAAEADLQRAEALMKEVGRMPPYHASYVRSARYLVDVLATEAVLDEGATPPRGMLRRVAGSRRAALRTSAWAPWFRTEALRLAGREAWLRGGHAKAIEWWDRALESAAALDARPEWARTLEDAGLALTRDGSRREVRGLDGASCLAEAALRYEALGLPSERELLGRVA